MKKRTKEISKLLAQGVGLSALALQCACSDADDEQFRTAGMIPTSVEEIEKTKIEEPKNSIILGKMPAREDKTEANKNKDSQSSK